MEKVLIVDNDLLILEFLARTLAEVGYEVVTAEDGTSALDILKSVTPDAIFVDLIMPNIDGRRLCRIIRGIERLKEVYLGILSGVAPEEELDLALIGADVCIAKGSYDEMARNIVTVLNHYRDSGRRNPSGGVIGGKNFHQRKIAGELLSVNRHFEVILERMSEGILEITSTGRVIYANPVALSLIGMDETEVLGSHLGDLFSTDDGKRVNDLLKDLDDSPRKIGEESPIHLNQRQLTLNMLPIKNGNGYSAITILNDVSEQKRMETILHQAQKMEALGTLAGGIAHNFNNLLMGIQGNISLMLMEMNPGHKNYNKLKMVEKCAQSGAELTNQLLGLARGGDHEVVPTDLNELVRESSMMFGRTKREIAIHTALENNIWAVEVDPGQIEQVMLNLYVNAWQAMPDGGELYLETRNVVLDEQYVKPYGLKSGRYVKISVTDTGSGMEKRVLRRIFEPFFTTKERGKGTGLGLASSYKIVRNHYGIINAYSEKGEGSTFNVFLPVSEKSLIEDGNSTGELVTGRETVLFVDDEEWVLDVAVEIMEKMGYRLHVAKSGKEAIDIYKERWNEIHIVILDMIMPGMGGGETLKKLKEINPQVKVLLSSGYGMNGQAATILHNGCAGFIQKPFFMEDLSKKLRQILDEG